MSSIRSQASDLAPDFPKLNLGSPPVEDDRVGGLILGLRPGCESLRLPEPQKAPGGLAPGMARAR
ncbi:MAG: hypothetical protein FJZ00_00955 [Candidatus Sericytochromatia bacterium]|uniref:Uncharacterized protein n=1 Tax=Candidatus Tanganyikabacteria bacterium TaxID=2961651 RepID=A0A937X4Y4_9BACT|nr:hypothetical protein [Candidatus Tanganyikabacteria bacterium]